MDIDKTKYFTAMSILEEAIKQRHWGKVSAVYNEMQKWKVD